LKVAEREEARRLRREEGLSVKEIEQKLSVSRGSVSLWVRDIVLTPAQKKRLENRENYSRAQGLGAEANRKKALEMRQHYQELGRKKAREGDLLHQAGCMLYWAEGRKSRTEFGFSNSDVNMMIFFIKFLTNRLLIKRENIIIRILCYTDCHTVAEIEDYWLLKLNLPRSSVRKTQVLNHPEGFESKRKRKLPYGVCHLRILRSVEAVQHIFGAIQEYSGIDNQEWII